jgi:hypothetical protein
MPLAEPLISARVVVLTPDSIEVYVTTLIPGYGVVAIATRDTGAPTASQIIDNISDATGTECPYVALTVVPSGETLIGTIDLSTLSGTGPIYVWIAGVGFGYAGYSNVLGPTAVEDDVPPTKIRIACGRVGGVRYAGLGFGAADNPVVPTKIRIACGRVGGVRYAGLGFGADENPVVPTKLRIACGRVAGLRYAGRGFGAEENPAINLEFAFEPYLNDISWHGFSMIGEVNYDAVASLVVTAFDAEQPSDSEFDESLEQMAVTGGDVFFFEHTGEPEPALRRAWMQVRLGAQRILYSDLALLPHEDFEQVSVTDTSPYGLRFEPPIAVNEILSWGNVVGSGTVNINEDTTYDVDYRVKAFTVYVGNYEEGWRASDTLFLSDITNALFVAMEL